MKLIRALIALSVCERFAADVRVTHFQQRHHRHHRHHHHNKRRHPVTKANVTAAMQASTNISARAPVAGHAMSRATRSAATAAIVSSTANVALHSQTPDTLRGRLVVNGPLPMGFGDFFSEVVAKATACQPSEVAVLGTFCEVSSCTKVVLDFQAPPSVVQAVESQAV